MTESVFQAWLIKEIKHRFTGAMVIKTDPTYIQGFPDLIVFYKSCWVALECKKNKGAHRQPNQEFYVSKMNAMSMAKFVYPENAEDVLDDMEEFFKHSFTFHLS